MSGASNIHWTQPGLVAKIENDGHGDTCGPIVIMDYLHLTHGMTLDNPTLDNMRQDLINWGLMDTPQYVGMTITSLAVALSHHYGVQPIKVVSYNPSLNFAEFRQDLINALTAHQLVIMETANAQALPDNQSGVQYHFVLFGGIDSSLGYYTCNGDTETGLRSGNQTTNPVWYGIGSLSASQPVGYIILPAVEAPFMLVIEHDANGLVTGAHDADNPHMHVGPGFAYAAEQQNLLNTEITTPESYFQTNESAGNVGFCVLSNRYLGTWTPASGVHLNDWAEASQLVSALYNDVQDLQSKLTASSDADTTVNEAVNKLSVDVTNLNAEISTLEADLKALQAAQSGD